MWKGEINGELKSAGKLILILFSIWEVGDVVIKSRSCGLGIYAGTFGCGDEMSVSVVTKQIQTFWVRNYITLKYY
jgi:hypothetical protein